MRSFTAIAGWVADVPVELLALLYLAPTPGAPSKTTLWRVVTGVDAAAVDAAIGSWLAERAQLSTVAAAAPTTAARAPDTDPTGGADPTDQTGGAGGAGGAGGELIVVAVDGKTVRGAVAADGTQIHLLAAATHGDQLVLAQVDVNAKTKTVPSTSCRRLAVSPVRTRVGKPCSSLSSATPQTT